MAIFEKIIKIKEQGAKQTENRLGSLVKTGLTIGAVTVAFKAFADQMKKASQAAAEQEKIFKSLETAVNLSGVSYKDNEKALRDLFATQQQYTKYGDTDSAQMLSRLIQLSGDYEGSVRALETAQDLASTGMFDMNTAARYVGMALAGNVEMLGRYIPELRAGSDGLKDLTTKAEKTEYAMKLLNEKFGGTARAELDTYAGQVQQLQNYIGDYREMIGDKLNPVLKVGAERLTEFFRRATETKLDTTIRQLQEMGVAIDDLNPLIMMNNMIKAEDAFEKAGNQFDRSARQLNNLKLSGELATSAISNVDGEWKIDTEQARNDIVKLQKRTVELSSSFEKNKMQIREYEGALKSGNIAQGQTADGIRRQIKNLKDQNLGIEWNIEGMNRARSLIIESLAIYENRNKLQEQYNKALEAYITKAPQAETATQEISDKIQLVGESLGMTAEEIDKFQRDILSLNDIAANFDIESNINIKPKIQNIAIENVKRSLQKQLESGKITEAEYTARLKAITPEQIDESILQPLDEIDVPEIHIYTDEQLQTDIQNIQGFVDKYSDEIDNITSIASGAGRIWENIIESRYNKDLKALKDTARYQKATNDERKVMEEDLYNSFADEREKYSKYQKAAAIAEAIINTAAAVVEALPNYALAGLTAAAGITQIGIIASQPIPQYAEGGLLPSNQKLFIANESGQEAILNAETTARLGSSGVDTLNSGGSLGNVMNIYINNPLLLENQQIDLVADMIVKRARQGFNDLEVRY